MKEKKDHCSAGGSASPGCTFFLLFCTGYSEKRFQKGKSDWPSLHVQQESAAHPFSGYGFITGRWLCLLMISVKCWMP